MKKFILTFVSFLLPVIAQAQFTPGAVLHAADLNAALAHPNITGGTIDNAPIGGTTRSTGSFTTLNANAGGTLVGTFTGGTFTGGVVTGLTSPIPIASGGNSTSVASVINVMASPYNAACNGAGDDSAAINSAITAAGGGSRVIIPTGKTCRVAGNINISTTNLEFDCQGATIVAASGAVDVFNVTGNFNVVRNCTVNANSIAAVGILTTGNHNKIDRNVVSGATNHGIAFDGSSTTCNYNEITRNESSGNTMIGISNFKCDFGRIIDNYSHDNGAEGITYDFSSYGIIANNAIIHNTGGTGGIGVDKTVYTNITANLVKDNTVAGVSVNNQVGSSDHGAITGNTFLNNGITAHIYFHTCTGVGTPIAGCTGAFQTIAWAVTGNATDSGAKAVVIDASSNNNVVTGNVISGSSNFTDNGTSDHFTANF